MAKACCILGGLVPGVALLIGGAVLTNQFVDINAGF